MVRGIDEQEHGAALAASSMPRSPQTLVALPARARHLDPKSNELTRTATHEEAAAPNIDFTLRQILKRYDRIGFGRRGVLDAEAEIRSTAAGLSRAQRADLHSTILTWLDGKTAADWAAPLHYNLPEHVQALAIRLCALLPIREGVPYLRELQDRRAFSTPETQACQQALREALARFERES